LNVQRTDTSSGLAKIVQGQQLDPTDDQAVNSRLLVRRQKKLIKAAPTRIRIEVPVYSSLGFIPARLTWMVSRQRCSNAPEKKCAITGWHCRKWNKNL